MRTPAWTHSLRFRLALAYTLTAFLLLALVAGGLTFLLLRQLDNAFTARLNERADTIAENFNDPIKALQSGAGLPSSGGTLVMLIDAKGKITAASSALKNAENTQFSAPTRGSYVEDDLPLRVTTRPLKFFGGQQSGLIWVALPETELIATRQTTLQTLTLALILTPLAMLLTGLLLGRHHLRGLGQAARVAGRLDPSSSISAIPLPKRRDEVYDLLDAINRLLARIDAQQAREKQLLGQIVHELGAPLTVLRASLDRAAQRTGDHEVRRAALVADELTFTTQDLMQLARGQLELKLAWHLIPARTLRDRLDRLVPDVRFLGHWNGMILCDPDRLTQALRNLLANARRAAGPDGTVEINLEDTPTLMRFTVCDNGPGLPEHLAEKIFEPFVSGSGSSGLGLSVARQIAELHGGTLTGGNRRDGGAQFTLTLPALDLSEDDDIDEDAA
ncbi:sensor histidine kinase [Deinococcus maricopensis]|uniref:histidine kinase n=1 Tax=Deinococcus maricopensis (strain DSM 21211 / LMG 22137 / NRRL B-23946 / LB-34) TaxID=709986 RepID=E8U4L4_DEIML|nr:HAMP domain-containing sensor histidine kinase [Deinococcus maricopensis]ADV68879.1 integral membrane sensor signal transduction histidine kinase [Deinococcus maricopensis DSM 21211]